MNRISSLWITGVALAGLLNGCGSESGAPANGSIDVQLSPKVWEVSADAAASFNDQPVLITVRSSNGNPVADVDITVSMDLSAGTVPLGDEAMFLFEDNDRDGVPDTGPYAGPVPPSVADMSVGALALPYRTKVDKFGSKQFVLRMSFGIYLSYRGQLNVTSGAVGGSGEFEVECADGPVTACP